jgi:magnesium transporter
MNKLTPKKRRSVGLAPGTLIHVGKKKIEKVWIRVIDYNESNLQELEIDQVEASFPFKETPTVTWLNIDGLHEVEVIEKIGKHFDLHPLLLEDILHTKQRPKFEDHGEYFFVVLKMLHYHEEENRLEVEQASFIVGKNFVISFQERVGDFFEAVRERLRNAKGRIRKNGPDYLIYALIDAIVDSYFIILEKLGERIEALEEQLLENATPESLQAIQNLKRSMIFLRKSVWPLREVISGLQRGESKLIKKSTQIFLRDIYDHTIQVIDTVESYRDMISGMHDLYLSNVSNKMNEIMKVLTIMATIFIPLTFIAGIYGMNFEYMPELKSHWGYFIVWFVMIVIGAGMVIFFKRKKWL